ncbi:MAG: hypothetical protein ABEJ30_03990 [Halorientalis sp.]
MERLPFADRLELLGLLFGALLVLAGLGTIAGLPWETAESPLIAAVNVVGALLVVGVGAGLAWLTQTERPFA